MSIRSRLQRLTLFDKLVVVAAVIGILFFAYIFFRKSTYLTVTIKVGQDSVVYDFPGLQGWFGQIFSVGMKEKDGLGSTRAEVLRVFSFDKSPEDKAVYLTTKLKVVYNRASNQYTYKGYPVLIGSILRLYLDQVLVDGMITHIEGVKDPRQNTKLFVKAQTIAETPVFPETSGIKEYIANALHVGDEIKDDQGNTIIKIVDKRVENARKVVTTSDGRVLLQMDPLKKDVYLTLEVEAKKINNKYFVFDDVPLTIGSRIPLNSSLVSVWPEITDIATSK